MRGEKPVHNNGVIRPIWLAMAFALGGIACSCSSVLAQQVAPSRLVPTLRPVETRQTTVNLPGPAVRKEPANAKRTFVFVRRISVINGFARLAAQTAALTARLEGRRVSVDDIYKLAAAIQQTYAGEGFPLVLVEIPPQRLQSGDISLIVVDGYIKAVDVSQLPTIDRNRAGQIMAPLVGLRHVTLGEIQRRLLLVGEIPGVNARNVTSNPDESGGVILALQGTQKLVSDATSVDNRLPSTLDTYEVTTLLSLNNPFGLGEQFYIGASSGYDLARLFNGTARWESVGGGFVLPLGDDGFNINPSYVWARTMPNPQNGPLTDSAFDRLSVKLNYPLLLTLKQIFRFQADFDYINENEVILGGGPTIYQDRYGAFRAAGTYGYLFSSGTKILATGTVSQGLGGRVAGEGPSGVRLSRLDASPLFTKLNLDLHLLQPFPDNFNLLIIGHGQTSFGSSLMVAEQLSLDGVDALSGYSAGTIPVDQGGTLRAEFSRELSFRIGSDSFNLYPYLFGAAGRGFLEQPFINEIPVINAASTGVGLRTDLGFGAIPVGSSINLELAKDFSNLPGRTDGYRGNVSITARF